MTEEREFSPCGLVSATVLKNPRKIPLRAVGPSLMLEWRKVPESLPPGAEEHWFSPEVWLALSDGRVVRGKCLHRVKGATYDAPVHDWFEGSKQLKGVCVLAWLPFAVPDFPMEFLQP